MMWVIGSLAVFAGLASIHYPIRMSTGANTWDSHGWPGGWLTRNELKTWVDHGDGRGMNADIHKVRWHVSSWGALTLALLVSCAAPGSVIVPMRWMGNRKAGVPTTL